MSSTFKIGLCQLNVTTDKNKNILNALNYIGNAANQGAKVVVLPEMFNCPYNSNVFSDYAESAGNGATIKAMAKAAAENKIYIIAGSIPELENDHIYNTSFIFDSEGNIIGRHRKVHLFDVDVKAGVYFKESEKLSAGNSITVISTEFCKIGIAICYDMRFPEIMRIMALKGAKLIIIPAAFNMVTGPAHWEQTIRARAIDNQLYVAAVSPARDEKASYVAFGNSMLADPWGKPILSAGDKETLLIGEIDLNLVSKIREELPLLKHRREDVYKIEEL